MIRDALMGLSNRRAVDVVDKVGASAAGQIEPRSLNPVAACAIVRRSRLQRPGDHAQRRSACALEVILPALWLTEAASTQIDWNEGKLQNGRVCVRPGIDGSLDEMRRKYHGLGSLLASPLLPFRHGKRRSQRLTSNSSLIIVWSCERSLAGRSRWTRAGTLGRLLSAAGLPRHYPT